MRISDWSSDVCSSDLTGIFGTIGSAGSFPFGDGASYPLRCRRTDKVMRREQLVAAIPVAPACLEARLQNLLRWKGKPFGRLEGEPMRHATGTASVPHLLRFRGGRVSGNNFCCFRP